MAVGPLVYWWGGAGAAPPATPLDKFTPKFLVGNALAGDGTSVSVAGFNYILDPGDGSGLLLAFASANAEDIAIRPGTYAFPVPTVLNVPANVRVTGAGRGSTLISNVTFVLDSGASLSDLSFAASPGGTAITANAGRGLLRDLVVVGNNIGLNLLGPGSFLMDNVDILISTQVDSAVIVQGVVDLTCVGLRTTGSLRSLDIQGGRVTGYASSFTGANVALSLTGGGVSFSDSTFQAVGGFVMNIGDSTNCQFKGCSISGVNCLDFMTVTTLTGIVFDSCTLTGTTSCVSGLGAGSSNVRFRDCTMSSSGITFSTLGPVDTLVLADTEIRSSGASSVVLNTEAVITGSTFTSLAAAGLVLNVGGCRISDTIVTGVISAPSLSVFGSNSTFSGVFINGGGAIFGPGVDGCSMVNSKVDITTATPIPLAAVTVEGRGNTMGLITYTPPSIPSVHFTSTSSDNIVLSVVGFGANPTVVSDLGTGNEVAHSIGI